MARESWSTIVVRVTTPRGALPSPPAVEVLPAVLLGRASATDVLHGSIARPEALAQLRLVRHKVEQRPSGEPGRALVVAVTSARGGEGTSTLAAQLAFVLGEASRARVALVEARFARPGLARVLGVDVPEHAAFSGQIARRLGGGLEPWRMIGLGDNVHAALERADTPGAAPGALQSGHFASAVRTLAAAYDVVVLDVPPVLAAEDAQAALRTADATVLLARGGITRGQDLRDAAAALGDKLLGVVLVARAA